MDSGLLGFFSAIIGAIVGGSIACFSSYYLWKLQLERKRKAVLKKLELDIISIHDRTQILKVQDPDNSTRIIQIIDTEVPFYSLNDFFFTYKDELFDIPPDMFNKLYRYFSLLVSAEIFRLRLPPPPQLKKQREENQIVERDYYFMLTEVVEAKKLEMDLIQELDAEIKSLDNTNTHQTREEILVGIIVLMLIGYASYGFTIF